MRPMRLILFLSLTYAGCAGQRPIPPPAPAHAPPGRVLRVPPAPLFVDDTVLALAGYGSGPVRLAVLGRRTLAAYELAPGGMRVLATTDLTPLVAPGAHLARHGVGCVEWGGGGSGSAGPVLTVRSTALDHGSPVEVVLGLHDHRFSRVVGDRLGGKTCAAPFSGLDTASRGRTVCLGGRHDASLCFFVDAEARMHALEHGGDVVVSGGPFGEPLAARGERGAGTVLVSAPSLPGEPDRVQEYRWDGARLDLVRESVPFQGRLLAAAPLGAGGFLAIAEATHAGGSIVRILSETELLRPVETR